MTLAARSAFAFGVGRPFHSSDWPAADALSRQLAHAGRYSKLRNTSASLAQVAEIVGYNSEAAFSRAFKKAFGAAPATWRRSNS